MLANPKAKKAIVGVLILAIGYFVLLPRFQAGEALAPEVPEFPNPGPTYTLEAAVYNLNTPSAQQPRYLKLGVTFEFEADEVAFFFLSGEALALTLEEFAEELGPKRPIIDDAVSAIVGSKTLEDVASALGRQRLKDELREAIAAIVGEPVLLNVFFTEFVFQ